MRMIAGLLSVAMLSGCASSHQATQQRLDSVVKQIRNADMMKITGTNVSFTITGATEICFSQIVNPIQAPKTALETCVDGAVSVAQIAAPIAGGVLLARELSDRASDIYIDKQTTTTTTTMGAE